MAAHVLVIDNDSALLELFEIAFRKAVLQVSTARNESQADAVIQAQRVDLLLVDLNLGAGSSGLSLAQKWSRLGCLPPFLVVTGTPADPRLSELKSMPEYRGLVGKPFSIQELVKNVRGLMENTQTMEASS